MKLNYKNTMERTKMSRYNFLIDTTNELLEPVLDEIKESEFGINLAKALDEDIIQTGVFGKIKEIAHKTIEWAEERNLIQGARPKDQFLKVVEECSEVFTAKNMDEYKDAIGDTYVTIVILAKQMGYSVDEIIDQDVILDMVVNMNYIAALLKDRNFYDHAILITLGQIASDLAKGNVDDQTLKSCQMVLAVMMNNSDINNAESFEIAYNEIKDRKGRMIDNVFVKEEDLPENK